MSNKHQAETDEQVALAREKKELQKGENNNLEVKNIMVIWNM